MAKRQSLDPDITLRGALQLYLKNAGAITPEAIEETLQKLNKKIFVRNGLAAGTDYLRTVLKPLPPGDETFYH